MNKLEKILKEESFNFGNYIIHIGIGIGNDKKYFFKYISTSNELISNTTIEFGRNYKLFEHYKTQLTQLRNKYENKNEIL